MDLEHLQFLLGEEAVTVEEEEGVGYRHVWVVAERDGDALAPVTLECLGLARQMASTLGAYVMAVLLGGDETLAQELVYHEADKVYLMDNPALVEYNVELYTKALADFFTEKQPEFVLFGATDMGKDLAPRLAQRLDTAVVTNCTKLEIDVGERTLVATYPVYNGEYYQVVNFSPQVHPQIATQGPSARPTATSTAARTSRQCL